MLVLENVTVGYNETNVIEQFSVTFERGKFYGILGPNGSGKTTLLKTISGVLKPVSGEIYLENELLSTYSNRQLAKVMSVLPQMNASSFANTVRETVSIGRYPHQSGFFSSWSKEDEEAVQLAMEQTDLLQYEHVELPLLSGGEQQRTFIAQALAQNAQLLLLDEPTNHLDITHQKQSLDIIRKKVVQQQLTVIAIFHDINLASLYCDEVILMQNGQVVRQGHPMNVVDQQSIEAVYDVDVAINPHPFIAKPQITMIPFKEQALHILTKDSIQVNEEGVILNSEVPIKVLSSAVYNAGLGWYKHIINRTVATTYQISDVEKEVKQYLIQQQLEPTSSVVMLTAVQSKYAIIKDYSDEDLSVIVVVTAGVGHAVDVSKAYLREDEREIGTINTWVIVNAQLTNEAFVQAMMTATEAKVKALQDEDIKDEITQTNATGTGTDSLLIAATQQNIQIQYAGPLTQLGKLIGRSVYETTRAAILQSKGGTY